MLEGKIVGVLNHFSIVEVLVKNVAGVFPVYFDHRPFANLIEAEGNIIGKNVSYDSSENLMRFAEA